MLAFLNYVSAAHALLSLILGPLYAIFWPYEPGNEPIYKRLKEPPAWLEFFARLLLPIETIAIKASVRVTKMRFMNRPPPGE
jgi:hypothetical protein